MAQWQQMQAQAAQYYGYDMTRGWNQGSGGQGGGYGGGEGGGGRRERSQPTTTLWVGNLTPEIREDDIRRSFEPYGMVESIRMLDAKNCAFVTFASLESSKAAHANTYGLKINGVEVKINWGRASGNEGPQRGGNWRDGQGSSSNYPSRDGGYGRGPGGGGHSYSGGGGYGGGGHGGGYGGAGGYEDRGPREDRRGGGRDEHATPSPNIWVGNVDPNVTEHELRTCFDRFGHIERVKLFPQKTCAFVNFSDLSSAIKAKGEMNGFVLFGQTLRVNFGKPRDERERERVERGGGADSAGRWPRGEYPSGDRERMDDRYAQGGGRYEHQQRDNVATSAPIPVSEPQGVDEELKTVVDKLVEAFDKNPELEAMTKQNQADNPKFAFLFPGREGHDYFLWKRYGTKLASEAHARVHAANGASGAKIDFSLPSGAEPLSANEAEDFEGILRSLDPSKEKIHAGAEFATTHAKKARAIANALLEYALRQPAPVPTQNVLHFVFLVNEIFNVVLRARSSSGSASTEDETSQLALAQAFLPNLVHLLRAADSQDNHTILKNIITRWKDNNVFSETEIAKLQAEFETSASAGSSSTAPSSENDNSKPEEDATSDNPKKRKRGESSEDAEDETEPKRAATEASE